MGTGHEDNESFGAGAKPSREVEPGFQPVPQAPAAAEADEPRRTPGEGDYDRTPLAQRIRDREGE